MSLQQTIFFWNPPLKQPLYFKKIAISENHTTAFSYHARGNNVSGSTEGISVLSHYNLSETSCWSPWVSRNSCTCLGLSKWHYSMEAKTWRLSRVSNLPVMISLPEPPRDAGISANQWCDMGMNFPELCYWFAVICMFQMRLIANLQLVLSSSMSMSNSILSYIEKNLVLIILNQLVSDFLRNVGEIHSAKKSAGMEGEFE